MSDFHYIRQECIGQRSLPSGINIDTYKIAYTENGKTYVGTETVRTYETLSGAIAQIMPELHVAELPDGYDSHGWRAWMAGMRRNDVY